MLGRPFGLWRRLGVLEYACGEEDGEGSKLTVLGESGGNGWGAVKECFAGAAHNVSYDLGSLFNVNQ